MEGTADIAVGAIVINFAREYNYYVQELMEGTADIAVGPLQ